MLLLSLNTLTFGLNEYFHFHFHFALNEAHFQHQSLDLTNLIKGSNTLHFDFAI